MNSVNFILFTGSFILVINLIYKIRQSEKYKAFCYLRNLSKEELAAFYNSYDEIFSDNTMISTLDDFNNNKPPNGFVIQKETKPSKYTADCYNIIARFCALGNVEKMYIPPCINNKEGIFKNQLLYEKKMGVNR